MRRAVFSPILLAAALAAGAAGFWLGSGHVSFVSASNPAASGAVIYYQHPDGKPVYSAGPAKTEDGRAFRAVRASEDVSFDAAPAPVATTDVRKIKHYRNPMGLPDVSKTPKKDSMGMDYIAVYEGDDDGSSAVTISPGKIQRIGVKTAKVERRRLGRPVRAPGTVQLDERRIAVISLRTEAFIDRVEDVTTGATVKRGQPLIRLYSPAIASAAAEYLALLNSKTDAVSAPAGTRQRLLNFAVPASLLREIEQDRKVPLTFAWTAPRDGIVLERNVSDGMRVMPGDVLFRIADLSVVWVNVDVAEGNLAKVKAGQSVEVRARSHPDQVFKGTVSILSPQLNAATRTVRVRIELQNPDLALRPDMYAEAVIDTGEESPVLAVPEDAVIDSGAKRYVLVDKGNGRFEPTPVTTGGRGDGWVEIREGVEDGATVVTSANFLIDAESNLKAALKALETPQ